MRRSQTMLASCPIFLSTNDLLFKAPSLRVHRIIKSISPSLYFSFIASLIILSINRMELLSFLNRFILLLLLLSSNGFRVLFFYRLNNRNFSPKSSTWSSDLKEATVSEVLMDGWMAEHVFDFWLAIGTRGGHQRSSYWAEAAINTLIGMTGKRDSSSDICIIRRFYVPFSSHINTENSLRQATDRQHNRPPPSACCLPSISNPNPWLQHLVRHLLGHLRGSALWWRTRWHIQVVAS